MTPAGWSGVGLKIMIHIAIGTKAQFIKMAPVIQKLQEKNILFNLIDLGQHSLITKELRVEFKIREPNVYLSRGENISRFWKGILWLLHIFLKGISSQWIKKNIFLNRNGICLIHGDTASTLLGLYLAKRAGLKVAHIEAGLRSFSWFEPFPEEILRVVAMNFSDILFAPSPWAFGNLIKMGFKNKSILIPANTGQESTYFSLSKKVDLGLDTDDFCLITFHRMENIFSKKRLLFIIGLIKKISSKINLVFVQHQPTINQLEEMGLWRQLKEIKNIHYCKILSHGQFIHLLEKCSFVITDGGSIQEEAFYLGKPCLLLRHNTERNDGLGENAVLSKFDIQRANYFSEHYLEFARKGISLKDAFASEEIVRSLMRYV